MAYHHRRLILFDDKKTLLEFKEAFDMLFSNGGPHTNRFVYEREDLDTLNNIKYYALALVCDTGTWNYINAWHKFDKVTVYDGKFKSSHIHYAGPNYEEPKTINDPTIKEVMDTMSDYQTKALYLYIGCIIDSKKAKAAYKNAYKTLDENQKKVCDYIIGQALKEETDKEA